MTLCHILPEWRGWVNMINRETDRQIDTLVCVFVPLYGRIYVSLSLSLCLLLSQYMCDCVRAWQWVSVFVRLCVFVYVVFWLDSSTSHIYVYMYVHESKYGSEYDCKKKVEKQNVTYLWYTDIKNRHRESLHHHNHHDHVVSLATDIPDPLSPLLPTIHRFWQVFRTTSRILT